MFPFKTPNDLEARLPVKAARSHLALVKGFADKLKQMRIDARISVGDMADALGIPHQDVLRLEGGNPEHAPSLIQISAYSIICRTPIELTYGEAEQKKRRFWASGRSLGGELQEHSGQTFHIQLTPPPAHVIKSMSDKN